MASMFVTFAASAQQTPGSGGMTQLLLMFALLGVFMWLIVLRPQKKERQERERKLGALKKGDRVVSIGGVHGKVIDIDGSQNILTVEVAPKVSIRINRSAVATVHSKESREKPGEKEDLKGE
ncbi:MAG TPA: preprotein translocase subunit YajC [Sumerlaeia bacterium]|nr:preprotein translocase subunit YajC [Sumerlaeia bacterium]